MLEKFLDKEYSIGEARQLNPVTLAFIGDAIYEIIVRKYVLDKNPTLSVHKLHLKTIAYVKAKSQSDTVKMLEGKLTEEEVAIFKRGRNAKSMTVPKNADVRDYRAATGFEAMIGYLYLTGQHERLMAIAELIFV